jgi:hypothetical protein
MLSAQLNAHTCINASSTEAGLKGCALNACMQGRRAEIKEELVTGVKLSESTASSNSGRKLGMQYTILVVSPHHTDARLGKHHAIVSFCLANPLHDQLHDELSVSCAVSQADRPTRTHNRTDALFVTVHSMVVH